MISDDERREVAKRLRGLDAAITNRDTLGQAVDKFMTAVCGDLPFSPIRYSVRNLCGLANMLADLIDRPTCEYVPIGDGRFGCSWCGHVVKLDYDVPVAEETHMPFNYCPNCSAEVVEDVQRLCCASRTRHPLS